MLDILYKRKGLAFATEFLKRISDNPITENANEDKRYFYAGWGENYQLSYLWKNNFEVAGHFTHVVPSKAIRTLERTVE